MLHRTKGYQNNTNDFSVLFMLKKKKTNRKKKQTRDRQTRITTQKKKNPTRPVKFDKKCTGPMDFFEETFTKSLINVGML